MSALSAPSIVPAAGGDTVDLSAAWGSFWTPFSSAIGAEATTLITVIGVVVLIASIAGYIFQKRRGGANTSGLFWAALFGAVLCAPAVLFPLLLQLADFIINGVLSLLPAG